jgi:hypothetical protein
VTNPGLSIREQRHALGWSQQALAELRGVTQADLSRIVLSCWGPRLRGGGPHRRGRRDRTATLQCRSLVKPLQLQNPPNSCQTRPMPLSSDDLDEMFTRIHRGGRQAAWRARRSTSSRPLRAGRKPSKCWLRRVFASPTVTAAPLWLVSLRQGLRSHPGVRTHHEPYAAKPVRH